MNAAKFAVRGFTEAPMLVARHSVGDVRASYGIKTAVARNATG